ncbi:uncharacterized protein CDAR_501921 [Caerostris darwini]|uniref:Gustatory receptor n=1 Tax=Caerostris darwini TaxID=1538125 RepID=A0AAV4TPX8_9ARAC|nr:uncharacterized protein CDAR_501921 [Caerostris darwini]
MGTFPCPEFSAKSPFFKVMWNIPKYLIPCLLCYLAVMQILWLCFLSTHKDEWAALIVLFLQLWIYICLFRSRTRIHLLTEELFKISNMLRAFTIQKKKLLKIYISMYCLFVAFMTVFFEVTVFSTGLIAHAQHKLRNSELVPAHLKAHLVALLNCSYTFITFVGNGCFAALPGYYCFVCYCMKQFLVHFKLKSEVLTARQDYQRILGIYKEINETMIMMDNFLSLPIFITVFIILASLFWYGYSFAFPPNVSYEAKIFVSMGFLQYFVLLLITLMPAAAANQAALAAREIVLSLPAWFPKRYRIIKLHVRRKFMHKTALTLWKIYRIDKSLLISAIGSLISYGILVGTLGSVQNSNNDN